jgi:hypothetical protein
VRQPGANGPTVRHTRPEDGSPGLPQRDPGTNGPQVPAAQPGSNLPQRSGGLAQPQANLAANMLKRQPGAAGQPPRPGGGPGGLQQRQRSEGLPQREPGVGGVPPRDAGAGAVPQRGLGAAGLPRRGGPETPGTPGAPGGNTPPDRPAARSPRDSVLPKREPGANGLPSRGASGLPQRDSAANGLPPRDAAGTGLPQRDIGSGLPQRDGAGNGLPQRDTGSGLPQRDALSGDLPQRDGAGNGLPQRGPGGNGLPSRQPGSNGLPQRGAGGLPQRDSAAGGLPQRDNGLSQRDSAGNGLSQRNTGSSRLTQPDAADTGVPQRDPGAGLPQRQPGAELPPRPLPTPGLHRPPVDGDRASEGAEKASDDAGEGRERGRHSFRSNPQKTAAFFQTRMQASEDPLSSMADSPIFAEMMSAWLSDPNSDRSSMAASFESPGDEGWEAARRAVEPQADKRTASGLPQRDPGNRLVPGGVNGKSDRVQQSNRDPDSIRSSLSRHQQGVRDGRAMKAMNLTGDKGDR